MKLTISILILLFGCLSAQNYVNDLEALYKRVEAGQKLSTDELERFTKKYEKQLVKDPDNATQLHVILANAYYRLSQFEKSEGNFLTAYSYAKQAADSSLKHFVAHSLAVVNQNANRLLEAEKYYVSCMAGLSVIYGQSSREYTDIFFNYTRLLIDLHKYGDASSYVEALLYYYKTLDGEKNTRYIALLNCKAIILQNTGHYPEAISLYTQIVDAADLLNLGDTLGYVISISNLGDVYRETGHYTFAIRYLNQAKNAYQQYGLREPETGAAIENNLALCYKATNELSRAEEAYNLSLNLYQQNGGTYTEPYCSTLSNKADLLRILGRYGEASELLLTALEIRKTYFGTRTENYANALSNLANVYFAAGNMSENHFFDEALAKNLEAEKIYREVVGEEHQAYANCMNNLSLCYLQFNDYHKAEAYKLKALRIIEKAVGKHHYRYPAYLISTYGLYRKTGQLEKAEKYIEEALWLVERNFGKKHDLYANAELALAEIKTGKGQYEEAGALYTSCLAYYVAQMDSYFDAMSEAEQYAFLSTISAAFESYNIYVLNYRLSRPEKDLSHYLRLSLDCQLLLKSLLANKSARVRQQVEASTDEGLKTIYAEWVLLNNELMNAYKSKHAADEDHSEFYKRISDLEVQLKSKIKEFEKQKPVSFQQLTARLKTGEAVIELFKTREMKNDSQAVIRYAALVVKKESPAPELVVFGQGEWLDQKGYEHYARCIDEQLSDTLSYSVYFKPLSNVLTGVSRLYVSPDGIFHKLNWSGLYNPNTKTYLVDAYEIYQTGNLASFRNPSSKPAAHSQLTASLFGYPDYDFDFKHKQSKVNIQANQLVAQRFGLRHLAKLPGTKAEVEEISTQLKIHGFHVRVYTEEAASEENLRKQNSPRILHIATHGFYLKDIESEDKLFLGFENSTFRNNSLLRSGLILAGAGPATEDSTHRDSENDGIVTASEARLLNLAQTELVVLSACQTALGDDMGTEGVAGLQRSLAIAGAKNMLMSLWPVDDMATQYLMTEFYRSYAASQQVESAFKQAQLAVKKKYPHPYFWAAFVLQKTFN